MPRKKVTDPLVTVLDFFEAEGEATCRIAQRIIARTLLRRFPPAAEKAKGVRRKRVPKVEAAPAPAVAQAIDTAVQTVVRRRRQTRRMRAGSQPPASEARPIVPTAPTTDGGQDDSAYTED